MEGTPSPTPTPVPASSAGQPAGFWIRLGALAIDALIPGLTFLLVILVTTLMNIGTDAARTVGGVMLNVILLINLVNLVILQTMWGGSIGKRILKLKIVQKDGSKLSWGKGLLRELIGKPISVLALNIGFWMIAFHPEKKGLHDLIAGTKVIKETA